MRRILTGRDFFRAHSRGVLEGKRQKVGFSPTCGVAVREDVILISAIYLLEF